MYVLGVVGPDSASRAVADRLASRLGETARVAEVERRETDVGAGETPASAKYRLSENEWSASGDGRTLTSVLEDLAPDHDYALLVGFPDADVPTVTLDGAECRGETLVKAVEASDVDPEEVLAKLEAIEPYETLESLVARAKDSEAAPYSGAIATFTGRVRAKEDPEDESTEFLEFEKYEGVAEERMAAIAAELEEREGVFEVVMHHRTGVIEYGEDIVFVVVLAGHREEAFRTVEDGINRLKDEVPIFKKEVTTDEQFWVHERS
ncbi:MULTISPECIES: molybdopterin synthase [Halorussus]|uniref:molybdopterin synthase n=1 Tax=Halorussus TaxID=1070314 RepID=UPI00209CFFA7|nr:molybdopterin synthase [Halorussus vallis]USZ77590.1 molybdopterin synthase [Halorussus vallis]